MDWSSSSSAGSSLDIGVTLHLPESEINFQVGPFMVNATVFDKQVRLACWWYGVCVLDWFPLVDARFFPLCERCLFPACDRSVSPLYVRFVFNACSVFVSHARSLFALCV